MSAPNPLTPKQRLDWVAHVLKAAAQNHHEALRPALAPHIPADAVVLDVGAHGGQYAKLFARMAPHGVVYAFEPSPYALSVLRPALAWNGLAARVKVQPYGLGAAPAQLVLRTPIKKRGGVGFGLAHIGEDADPRAMREDPIEIRTLDGFAAEVGLSRVDFLKADVEGWEGRMIEGGLKTLERFRPTLLLELAAPALARSGMTPTDVGALLFPLGYQAQRFEGPRLAPTADLDVPGDYLFTAPRA